MKTDLEKANEALAGGRSDEASVYAWNALADIGPDDASGLARIARELDDPWLLREIERRGFSTLPAEEPEREPVKRKPSLRLVRALPALAVALFIAGAVVTSIPTESGERHPTANDAASEVRFAQPILAEKSGVWLVPLGEPGSVDVDRLAKELAVHYRIPIAVLPDIALPSWTLDANEQSLVAAQLILLLSQAYRAQGGAAIIGITDYEMYARRKDVTHVFSWRAPPHYGVVSTSSLAANVLDRLRGHSRDQRTRKLVERNIGFLYYRRHEVADPHSLLRPPMHGADDIDKLEETLYAPSSAGPALPARDALVQHYRVCGDILVRSKVRPRHRGPEEPKRATAPPCHSLLPDPTPVARHEYYTRCAGW